MNIQSRITQLKIHLERGYNVGLSKEHPQMKRWWKELYSLTEE
jgi:hypothetical protein